MSRHHNDEWIFSPVSPEDAPAMRRLARHAYGIYVDRIGREPAPMASDYEQIASSGMAVVVRRESQLDGMVVFSLDADSLLVENIAVSSRIQGAGLGSSPTRRGRANSGPGRQALGAAVHQ